jgi:ABC-type multidrug transport system ATPase subunit
VLEPDAGDIKIDGVSLAAAPVRAKARIGWLAEGAPLPGEFRVSEYLASAAAIRGIPREAIGRWADRCQIDTVLRRRISQLSRGFRQRVALAAAMLHDPAVLVLDEPSTGLDPSQSSELRTLLAEIAESAAVLYSSHNLAEVEATCHRVAVLACGNIVFDGRFDERDTPCQRTAVEVSPHTVAAAIDGEHRRVIDDDWIACVVPGTPEQTAEAIVAAGGRLRLLKPIGASLEEAYAGWVGVSTP